MSRKRSASKRGAGGEEDDPKQREKKEKTNHIPSIHSASSSSSSVTNPRLSSAQLLYADGLHSIFKFLGFGELSVAMRSCRGWMAAAGKEKSRGIQTRISSERLSELLSSPLRSHVATFVCTDRSARFDSGFLSLANFASLAALPSLTAAEVVLDAVAMLQPTARPTRRAQVKATSAAASSASIAPWDAALARVTVPGADALWPQRLLSLNASISVEGKSQASLAPSTQVLIDCIGRLLPSLTSLQLDMRAWAHVFDLSPLIALGSLRRLSLMALLVDEVQIGHLKQLAALETLQVSSGRPHQQDQQWTPTRLAWLCRPPHRLQKLQQLDICDLSAAHLAEMMRLPSLRVLDPIRLHPDALPLLCRVPTLRTLAARPAYSHDQMFAWNGPNTLPHLKACAGLTSLLLELVTLTVPELIELTSALPLLESLVLYTCPLLSSAAVVADDAAAALPAPALALRSLRVRSYQLAHAPSLIPFFRRCGGALRSLEMDDVLFADDEDLAHLVSAAPQLETLKLGRPDLMNAAAGAGAAAALSLRPLQKLLHLHTLTLHHCACVTDAATLLDLAPIQSLRSLTVVIKSMPAGELNPICAMLTVPSALLPQLTQATVRLGY